MAEYSARADHHRFRSALADARVAVVKRAKAVALFPLVIGLVAWAAVAFVPDRYAAFVLIQVDPGRAMPSADEPKTSPPAAFELERREVEKQIERMTSPALLDSVVTAMDLTADPEFQSRSWLSRLMSPLDNSDPHAIAREALETRLSVRRVHNSSLVNIGISSYDAAKAAKIANAVAARYIAELLSEATANSSAEKRSAEPTASEKVFASLLDRYGLTRTLTGSRIVEAAKIPDVPAGPKRFRMAATVAMSTLLLMLMLAVLLERDTRLRTRKVEQMLACPHMTSLPAVTHDDEATHAMRRARLIIAEPGCRYAEAVRAACDALKTRANGDGPSVILTVSALTGEGAEPFASNIAHHLAVDGQKTLLVDCDFHAKVLSRELTPHAPPGLLDQIASHAPVENVILRDNLTGLHFLPSCGSAPIPLAMPSALRSVAFTAAFQHLKARFPTIIISAPPLLEADDAQILADLADQIVFLTAWHRTPRALAKKAVALLEANQRKIAGAVLADISDDRDAGFMTFAAMFNEIRRAARLPAVDHAA